MRRLNFRIECRYTTAGYTKSRVSIKSHTVDLNINMLLLGFLDEPITEDYADTVDFTTNKVGGFPNWLETKNGKKEVRCNVCGSVTPLLLQMYAPINERPQHHRTLYIFACIRTDCWGDPKSWKCLKSQVVIDEKLPISNDAPTFTLDDWSTGSNHDWNCDGNDKTDNSSLWGNEAAAMINRVIVNEENGNELSDVAFVDAKPHIATAEIEPDEDEPITVDPPTMPRCNVFNLLKLKPPSRGIRNENIHFIPWFIYAVEERMHDDPLSEHVQSLLSEYTKNKDNEMILRTMNNVNNVQRSDEKYEKSCPAHGDKLFHSFMSRIKSNPDQVVRYCRNNSAPLFLYEKHVPARCRHCHGDLIFEVQILPTLISHLKLSQNGGDQSYLEFGSVFVYTCRASCDGSTEENVVVQYEQF